MSTIIALAWFFLVIGYGIFILNAMSLNIIKYAGHYGGLEGRKQQAVLEHYGVMKYLKYKWLCVGIVSTIILYTL